MKRIKRNFVRDLEWEKRVGFDIHTDYMALIAKYNQLVADRNQDGIHKLLSEQEGMFMLSVKASYQKGMMEGSEYLIESM